MLIPPKYVLTPRLSAALSQIEACRAIIDNTAIPPAVERNLHRQSTLKSSLFSARIEGNPLTLDDLHTPSKTQQKAEVFNILKAFNRLTKTPKKDVSVTEILSLHRLVMAGLTDNPGHFRREASAIFNPAGIAVYLPPPPSKIVPLIKRLISFTNHPKEPFIPVKAALVHYSFEKIHPFLDGNGRTGRLVLQKILYRGGYGMKGLVSLEEYIDTHRSDYYRYLEDPDRDVTDFVEFITTALAAAAQTAKEVVLSKQQATVIDYLLPRRAEIYLLIKEQRLINFDQVRRRFLAVNERTLRYDLKQLQDAHLIIKRGTTKGVYYQPV